MSSTYGELAFKAAQDAFNKGERAMNSNNREKAKEQFELAKISLSGCLDNQPGKNELKKKIDNALRNLGI